MPSGVQASSSGDLAGLRSSGLFLLRGESRTLTPHLSTWMWGRVPATAFRVERAIYRCYSARVLHRAAAAALAISDRRSGLSRSARSFPPLLPPSFPRSTRSGSFAGGGASGQRSKIASMASTVALARRFGSAGILGCFIT